MLKFRLLLLSLVVFASALHAGEKENKEQNQSSFMGRLFSAPDNVSKEKLSQRRGSVQAFPQALSSALKPQEISFENDSLRKEFLAKLQQLRVDLLEGQSELQRQISGVGPQFADLDKRITDLTTSALQLSESINARLNSQVVETITHDLEPDVNELKQKLQLLGSRLTEYELQSNDFVTNEDLEALQANYGQLKESIQIVEAIVNQLPTSESVRSQITEATEPMNEKIGQCEKQAQSLEQQLQAITKTVPTADNPQGLATQADVEKTVQVLNGQLADKADRSDLNDYATKEDIKGFVAQKTHQETVQTLQDRIIALEKNNPREQLKSGIIYVAKQSALGCVSYRLAPHMASLLRALNLENSYVDLETVAVPTTTFAVSFLARLAKEAHEKGQDASVQDVGKESLVDAGVSAGMMGLRYIFFDDQMNEHVEQMSETERTAGYAGCYAILRSVVALFV